MVCLSNYQTCHNSGFQRHFLVMSGILRTYWFESRRMNDLDFTFLLPGQLFLFFVFLGGLLYACSHVLSLGDFNLFCCLQPVVNGLCCPARHSFQFSYMYKLLSSNIGGCYVCNIFIFGWYDWVENSKPSYLLKRGYHQPVTCDIWMFMI